MDKERIPFLDLQAMNVKMEHAFIEGFREILHTGRFINGPQVEEFENAFALFCGTRYAVGVGSGTDAVRFALMAVGVKQGDLVITVPNTFIATSEAISQAGATPIFIDVDERTSNMSPQKLKTYMEENCFKDNVTGETIHMTIGKPVRAIVPVHLYGQTADMDPILETAMQFGVHVVEDACQAHGAKYFSQKKNTWIKAGALGKAAGFSFYPGKNLGAFGEAGAVTTDDKEIAETIKMLRDHGQIKKYFHEMEGYNGRLDTIQASILQIKMNHLEEWNEARRARAENYNELLRDIPGITIPYEPSWSKAVYHLYVIRTKYRDILQGYLNEKGIETGLHYPVPLHQQKAYRSLGYKAGTLPVSEQLAKEIVSLPMFPHLLESQQKRISEVIGEFSLRYTYDKQIVDYKG